jgi:hypothetical protein
MAALPPGAWVVRNYVATGYAFLNLSYVGGNRAALSDYSRDLRFLDPSPRESEIEARQNLVTRRRRLDEELARIRAANSREERRQVLRDGLLNVQPLSASEVLEGRAEAILRLSVDWQLASISEQLVTGISRLGRTLCPKTNSFDMMSRAKEISDPIKFTVFALANVEWAIVLIGGIIGILGCSAVSSEARCILASVIIGCSVAALAGGGEPRYSFPFEFALMIGSIAFLANMKETLGVIVRSKWRLAISLTLLLFIGWSWIAAAMWGFSESISWTW